EAGGGGGGYFGGGGGGDNRGGAGGSGYFGGLTNGATSGSTQGTLYPPNTTDADYPSTSSPSTGSGAVGTAGDGASTGNSTGGNGFIVLQWSPGHAPSSSNEDCLAIDSSMGGKWVPQPSFQNLGFLLEKTYVSDPSLSDSDVDGFADNLEYNAGSNPQSNTSSPLEYGLTVWYPFDGNASDMSGKGRHGTTYNGAAWAAGKVGQALSLDGVDDYMDAGDFEIGGAVTFAAWVKYDAFKHWSRIFDFGNGQDNNNILIANDQTSATSRFNLHLPAGNPSLTGTNLTLNAWLHRAGVIEANGNMKLYLNGTLIASNTNTSALPTLTRTQQYVGRSNWSNDGYLDGLIDDFRIYNRALSATEVSNLYQLPNSDADGDGYTYAEELIAGTSPYSASSHPNLETGLMAWYPFDGNTSDMSGNDRDATAVNTHSFVSGKIGSGVRIVGSDSGVAGHVLLPYISSLENADTTFAFWVWEETMLHSHGEAYLAYGQIESVHNYIGGQSFNFGSNTYVSGITRASWNHYAVTRAGSVRKGYLNGTLVAQGSWSAPASYSPTESALGRHWWSGTAASSTRLVAIFDDLRIYDRALTANEITSLQTWTSVTNSPPANL
ncbi:MAG: LamG domain-containing protein, partial [Opitutales bacterium]|nr:LamG domain-containing protein [Opitutales bacterium]